MVVQMLSFIKKKKKQNIFYMYRYVIFEISIFPLELAVKISFPENFGLIFQSDEMFWASSAASMILTTSTILIEHDI